MNAPSKPTPAAEGPAPEPPETGADFRYELSPDLVTLTEGRPAEAEAIRTVRTHVVARHLEDGRRGLALCGATKGVGCTFTAVNLAVALSQAGVATLLIDADLRSPEVDKFIRPLTPQPGLKDRLGADPPPLADCIHFDVLPNLSILYSGGVADDAQELLASEGFKALIERCLRDFEFTIIDTSSANQGADARRVSRVVGYALIVARAHVSRVNELSELAGRLQEDGARVIGSVLNET